MNIGVTEISPRAVQRAAEKNFKSGYYCCEALMCTIRDEFKLDVPKEVIAMSSGMAVGAGKSGCVCGAFNGGLLALGMFFGRTEQDGPTNPKSVKCMELVHELHDWFKKANGKNAICCRVLTKEFNMGQGEHKEQCIFFTGLCAWKVAQIVCRERESRIWTKLMNRQNVVQLQISRIHRSRLERKTRYYERCNQKNTDSNLRSHAWSGSFR